MTRWAFLFLIALEALSAQDRHLRNPSTSAEDVAAGGRIFRSHCAECHGLQGGGGRGPDLTLGVFRHGSEDGDLLETIGEGVEGTEMPGIYMEEYQVWQIVSYVRSLSAQTLRREMPGNRDAGEQVFRGKGGCAQCHMLAGDGGRSGPDLTDIGGRRSPAYLRTALLEPNKDLRREWWSYRLSARNGEQASGLCMNEDTYSIQLLDVKGNLRSFPKSELSHIQIRKESAMPAYGALLSQAELDDLVAYLSSLRRKRGL